MKALYTRMIAAGIAWGLVYCVMIQASAFSNQERCMESFNTRQEYSALIDLLRLLDVPTDGTLPGIVDATQKRWLRPAGKERWEVGPDVSGVDRNVAYSLLQQLGFTNAAFPSNTHYDYVLVHGGAVDALRDRLGFLVTLWNLGVRFDAIILLTGERYLDPRIESETHIFGPEGAKGQPMPKTEAELMSLIFRQLDVPAALREVPLQLIDAPAHALGDGRTRRPNTGDTVAMWLSHDPVPGSCLAISSQPFVKYQQAVMERLLPAAFSVETVGYEAKSWVTLNVYLDSVARWLYEISIQSKQHSL